MERSVRLEAIPGDRYSDYRYEVIFKAYKWDPQVEDHNTISGHVVLLERETARCLERWAERLAEETARMEEALLNRLPLAETLGLPRKILRMLTRSLNYDRSRHVRLMRFDFHPTTTGWAISEINSDVPGGFAEASMMPRIAAPYFDDYEPGVDMADRLLNAFRPRIVNDGAVALIHATSYADDRQVMQFIGDYFEAHGMPTVLAAPAHLRWRERKAFVNAGEGEKAIGGVVRFFPLEWLVNLPRNVRWQEGFGTDETPSCNHPVAILAQSKRLPLIWDRLGVDIPIWRQLLPETREPGQESGDMAEWVCKPALGRVGEGISIKEALTPKELAQIEKTVRRHPRDWVVQRRFHSLPLKASDGQFRHLCIGVFTVDGKCAGFYGRLSPYPRIDARAKDIPVLVAKEGKNIEG